MERQTRDTLRNGFKIEQWEESQHNQREGGGVQHKGCLSLHCDGFMSVPDVASVTRCPFGFGSSCNRLGVVLR